VNEAETSAEHIDPALAAAGWGVAEGSCIRREYPFTHGRLEGYGWRGKSLTADYLLICRSTKLAAFGRERDPFEAVYERNLVPSDSNSARFSTKCSLRERKAEHG